MKIFGHLFSKSNEILTHLLRVLVILSISSDLFGQSKVYSVIPLKFFSQEPVAKVVINGLPINLIVDLGTSGFDLMLSKKVLDGSGAKLMSFDNKNFYTNYRRQKYPIKDYLISNVQLGGYKLHNLRALEFPGMGFFSNKPEQMPTVLNNGTIGVKLLKRFYVLFDYAHHKMLLSTSHTNFINYKVNQWKKIPIYYASDNILTKGFIGNVPVRIILDTGNNALTMSSEIANKIKPVSKIEYKNRDEHRILSDLKISNYLLKSQVFQVHNTHPEADISLGWDFFKNHIVYFNFKEMYMAFE